MDIIVENIKCSGCVHSIKSGLLKMEGVNGVEIDIENGQIHIDSSTGISREKIVAKLHDMGYPVPGKGSGITTATSYVSCMIGRVTS